ncbi:MAG: hypothetical protein QY307_11330 [Acidimicrobiia bacterium]|nr:MAG: hypothetical protein QY307_11330 [Acidimicrobiia bacterium]
MAYSRAMARAAAPATLSVANITRRRSQRSTNAPAKGATRIPGRANARPTIASLVTDPVSV